MLATTELLELLRERGADLAALPPAPWDSILPAPPAAGPAAAGASNGWHAGGSSSGGGSGGEGAPGAAVAGSGSGGYLEHVFRTAARELFGRQLPPGPLAMRVGRNAGALEGSCAAASMLQALAGVAVPSCGLPKAPKACIHAALHLPHPCISLQTSRRWRWRWVARR